MLLVVVSVVGLLLTLVARGRKGLFNKSYIDIDS